ncbi:hypothetical protein Syun_025821 [Stephania yunnanensis]|uniref:Uncharacterized protein n=1 Tax=Stephania yunnanensis TaxID=152371 RepID=A0AAP0HW43_9MAGN
MRWRDCGDDEPAVRMAERRRTSSGMPAAGDADARVELDSSSGCVSTDGSGGVRQRRRSRRVAEEVAIALGSDDGVVMVEKTMKTRQRCGATAGSGGGCD